MVNAVLRKLAAAPCVNRPEETVADLALAESHPVWMVERWASFYGLDATRAICLHGQTQPSLVVRLASDAEESELAANGIVLSSGRILTAARTVVSGDVAATTAFHEGRVRMQDEGSQLVAEIAAANLDHEARNIMDTCAAPGGKTLILAERNPSARILACESSPQRLERLRQRLAAYSDRIECRLADATQLKEDAAFDLILADVPCSGTGTLGRNPEIRHRLRPEDLPRQAERQRAILTAALRAVRPDGRVVYSTCSLELEENEQVVAAVLAAVPSARLVPLHASIESLLRESILDHSVAPLLEAALTPEGALRLLPGAFHTDGFFIALIEKFGERTASEASRS
jgi:16S rRNA (cytosine967-C5)-methyltransferase